MGSVSLAGLRRIVGGPLVLRERRVLDQPLDAVAAQGWGKGTLLQGDGPYCGILVPMRGGGSRRLQCLVLP